MGAVHDYGPSPDRIDSLGVTAPADEDRNGGGENAPGGHPAVPPPETSWAEAGSGAYPGDPGETAPAPGADVPESAAKAIPNPAALIFDLDGTLVDTVELRIEAWMRTFAEIGFPADRNHVARLIGADGRRLAAEVAAVADRRLSDERAEAVDRRSGEIFGELNTHPRPHPGVTALLCALDSAGIPWSIATSSRADQVRVSVAALALPEPPEVTDGSHVALAKPAPDLLLHAAERLNVLAYRCWYVGDATWDMRAAQAATMVGVGIASGTADMPALAAAGARFVFPRIGDLQHELILRGVLPPVDPVSG